MEVTGGGNSQDVVPIQIRMPILQTWVNAKQMAQQQITRNLGIEEEVGSLFTQTPQQWRLNLWSFFLFRHY